MSVEQFTPVMLRDLYVTLSKADRHIFLKLIASHCTGLEPLLLVSELPPAERFDFNKRTFAACVESSLPMLIHHARILAKDRPDLTNEDFEHELKVRLDQWSKEAVNLIGELEREKFKEKRDRHSDPAIVKRNVEICDLRRSNPRLWSHTKLAKKFDLPKSSIQRIIREETKWRKLGEKPGI